MAAPMADSIPGAAVSGRLAGEVSSGWAAAGQPGDDQQGNGQDFQHHQPALHRAAGANPQAVDADQQE